jgi:hypothetical protein
MGEVLTLIREVMTLTSTVGGLKSDVEKLFAKIEDHTERIVRLENREELLLEKMRNAAIQTASTMNLQIIERLHSLDQRFGRGPEGDTPKKLPE